MNKIAYFKSKLFALGLVLCLFVTSCDKEDDPSNLTGILTFQFTNDVVKDYTFTVDEQTKVIQNTDSLPYMTDVSALTATYTTIEKVIVKVGTTDQVSGSTTNDFSSPVEFKAVAEDGVTTKVYTVKVNVAKLNPEQVAWNQLTPEADFGAYNYVKFFTIGDKKFVAGSVKGSQNDYSLYSSTDGAAWTKVDVPDLFPRCAYFGYTEFNNKHYIIGGFNFMGEETTGAYSTGGVNNKVWESTDGTTWTNVTDGVDAANVFTKRGGAYVFNHDSKLWVVGGYGFAFGSPTANTTDCYTSTDGATWTKVADNGLATAYPARDKAAHFVHDGKMWIVGGVINKGNAWVPDYEYKNDIWTSTDGVTWTEVTQTTPFSARSAHQVFVYNDKLWMVGGEDADGLKGDMLVSSDNGVTWSAASDEKTLPASFKARSGHSIHIDADSNIWIAGGKHKNTEGNTVYLQDVWSGKLNKLKK